MCATVSEHEAPAIKAKTAMDYEALNVGKSKAIPKSTKSIAKFACTKKSNRVASQPRVQKSTPNKLTELIKRGGH